MRSSLCKGCYHLEVRYIAARGRRFTCWPRYPRPRTFGRIGRLVTRGYPEVRRCAHFEAGRHYSLRRYQEEERPRVAG